MSEFSLPSPTFALPQELVDIIVPIVADHRSLKACCLVSRSFCAPAQRQLFASLELLPSSRAWQEDHLALASLDALQTQSPQISGYVQRLTIDLGGPIAGVPAWIADEAFPRVLRRFDRLTTLVLDSELHGLRLPRQPLKWTLLPPPAQAALAHIMVQPTLKSLTLRGIQFAVFSELRDALAGRTQLGQLLAHNVYLKRADDPQSDSAGTGTLLLDSLTIRTDDARFIRHLPTLLHIPALQGLKLPLPSKKCEDAASFVRDARALQTLTINLQHEETKTCGLALDNLRMLDTLEIHFDVSSPRRRTPRAGAWVLGLLTPLLQHGESALAELTLKIDAPAADPDSVLRTLGPFVPLFRAWAAAQQPEEMPLLTLRVLMLDVDDDDIARVERGLSRLLEPLDLETDIEVA